MDQWSVGEDGSYAGPSGLDPRIFLGCWVDNLNNDVEVCYQNSGNIFEEGLAVTLQRQRPGLKKNLEVFRVLSEMRGKILYIDPKNLKIFNKMMSK